jgi:hypothetical protein
MVSTFKEATKIKNRHQVVDLFDRKSGSFKMQNQLNKYPI